MKKYKSIFLFLLIFTLFMNMNISYGLTLSDEGTPAGDTVQSSTTGDKLDAMAEVARNEQYILYLDSATTNFAVENIATGSVWYAIPPDIDSADVSDDIKNQIKSLFRVNYTIKDTEFFMDSFTDSVSKGQFKINPISNGVRIDFVLGTGLNQTILPKAISENRMNDLVLNKINEDRKKRRVLTLYRLLSKETAPSDEDWVTSLKEYPILAKENIYVFNGGADREVAEIEDVFKGVGYTSALCNQDNKATGQTDIKTSDPYFKIPLEITLNQDGLSVKLPAKDIVYDVSQYYLYKVDLLSYFSAGKVGDDGYVLYPDGSGTLIRFDKATDEAINGTTSDLYGDDNGMQPKSHSNVEQSLRMPVFGIKKNNTAFLAVIEKGDAIAEITTNAANVSQPYFNVFASFNLKYKDEFNFSDWGGEGFKWTVIDKNAYKNDIVIRYYFLTNDKANFAGMANTYRSYLIDKKVLTQRKQEDIPFYLEVMGVFQRKDRFLGIPMSIKTPLTTFSQAENMMDTLLKNNIHNIQMKYTGWANGGLRNTAFSNISVEGVLGGEGGFTKLIKFANDNGIGLYPAADFVYVGEDAIFDGFSPNADAIRTLDKKIGGQVKNNLSDAQINRTNFKYALSPNVSLKYAEKFNNKYAKFKINGLSLLSLGSVLNANFSKDDYVNRDTSKNINIQVASNLSKSQKLMIDGGNAYLYPYAEHILDMPQTSSHYQYTDESIPFMQMVLHGYIDYAGEAINLSGDYVDQMLLAASNGCGVYFIMNANNTKYLKDTEFSTYFSTDYSTWINDAIHIYDKLNAVLKEVSSSEITDYVKVADKVYKTVYANGKSVLVNFSDSEYVSGQNHVGAKDFMLIK